jgi:iron complex transport system substrate-binding protein
LTVGHARSALRIVSLLPGATDIVCALGRGGALVGITHSCDLPPGAADLPRVTRTEVPVDGPSRAIDDFVREAAARGAPLYQVDEARVGALAPDLIVTQGLCEVCAVDESSAFALAERLGDGVRVVSLTPHGLESTFVAISALASAMDAQEEGRALVASLRARVTRVEERSARIRERPRVAYLEWLAPPFSCGHWGPELVRLAGGIEGVGKEGAASRALTWQEIAAAAPEVVLVACCGFSVARTERDLAALANDPLWNALPAVQSGRVYIADGNRLFSRPGPGLVDSLELLAHALHPDVHLRPASGRLRALPR